MRSKIVAVIALLVALTFITIGLSLNQIDLIYSYFDKMAQIANMP
ncbi:hypothetical protein ES706_04202 [subsurface metagenome]